MRRWLPAAVFFAAAGWQAARLSGSPDVVDIGSRRELFVDRYLIARMEGADLRLGQPVDHGPVLRLDRPWEGAFCGYFTVLDDDGLYRMYYRGVPVSGEDGSANEVTCYAESRDGIHWTKPDLGYFEVGGTRRNNVILAHAPPFSHNFCPMIDRRPGVPAAERYKAVAGTSRSGLVAFVSADGRRWRRLREVPVIPYAKPLGFDSQNLAFWSESERQYVCYMRSFKEIGGKRYRWVSRATSQDFVHWTKPLEMSYGDAPPEHLYTNQTSPYSRAPHLYISLCARFEPGRQVLSAEQARAVHVAPDYFKDCSDAVLVTSRGGNRYDRTFLEAFLRPGLGLENWVSRSNYPALNVVQTAPQELSFYVAKNYGQPTAYVRRYGLRLDGFASLHSGYGGGEAVTRPLRFQGRQLEINYATSAAGGVRIEIQDESGRPFPGYSLEDAQEIIGDELARVVSWKQGSDLRTLAGKAVRLRFALKDADVYSFRFGG